MGQSDLPFRTLVRRYGTTLCYTEMFLADRFAAEPSYRAMALGSEGLGAGDHPTAVQFAANDPAEFVAAALEAQRLGADLVDLNLGW